MSKLDPRSHGFEALQVPANGIFVHAARAGSGPPLVLLHGWPEFWLTWARCMHRLKDQFELIAPDLRGFGATAGPVSGPSDAQGAEVLAADLLGMLDALGLKRVGLVAHDVGAYAAQVLARGYPERLTGLFFFNCPYAGIGRRWADADHLIETWYQYFNQMPFAAELVGHSRAACELYIGHFLRHWAHEPHAFDDDFEAWIDNFMRPGNLQGGFNWYRSAAPGRAAAIREEIAPEAPLEVPARVLWGRHDPVLKVEWIDRLGQYLAEVEVGIAEDAGHFVHYEQPDLASRSIADFFERRV